MKLDSGGDIRISLWPLPNRALARLAEQVRRDLEDAPALLEAHNVEPRRSTRQVEHDVTRGMITVCVRWADFNKRGKCLQGELCDRRWLHSGRIATGYGVMVDFDLERYFSAVAGNGLRR